MPRVPLDRFSHNCAPAFHLTALSVALILLSPPNTLPQAAPPASETASQSLATQQAPKKEAESPDQEIASHDVAVTFKVNVNLILVRVVARDNGGKVIPNLTKEDFQLTDNRKPQIISSFSVETPASRIPPTVRMDPDSAAPSEGTSVQGAALPQHFVTLYFDDLHLSPQDALLSRQAVTKLFAALSATDRISIYTTSGAVEVDYTADREKLSTAVQRILPHPLLQQSSLDCPPMTFYEAYQIVEANDPLSLAVATQDAAGCSGNPYGALSLAQSAAQRELPVGESQIQFAFANLTSLIRRMSGLPGQRVIVMMSPGFFVTPAMHQTGEIIDRATRANVVINTIDARGLYTSSFYDASNPDGGNAGSLSAIWKEQLTTAQENAQDDILAEFADGTGGLFFHNRNDIDQGLLQAAAEPEVSYILGFTPQNLKLDGTYHHLKVTLVNKQKWALQARHGYFAPKGQSDPEALAKEEIESAVFSQEEMHELHIDCRTQFFKGDGRAHLSVITHLDTKGLKFRRADDRNHDKLTIATAVFDQNGNLLTGLQKILELRLKDTTLDRVNSAGLSVKSNFDLQPGTFLVRVVVRDSEGAQMAAINRGVVIP